MGVHPLLWRRSCRMLDSMESIHGFPPCLVLERGRYTLADKMAGPQMRSIEQRAILYSVRLPVVRRAVSSASVGSGARSSRVQPRSGNRLRQSGSNAHHVVRRRILVETRQPVEGVARRRVDRPAERMQIHVSRHNSVTQGRTRDRLCEAFDGHVVLRHHRLRSPDQ